MGSLQTDLGPNALVLLRFEADEHQSALFEYRVAALSEKADVDLDQLIGTHATVHLKSFTHPDVSFDGIITDASFAGVGENGWRYDLVLRPWFWLAGRRRNQRIYHNKTVVQILDELLAPYGALGQPAVENRLNNSYPTLEYTVQYRESDLDFATRLMERFGISYHFTHTAGSHTLVMTDAISAHEPLPGKSRKFIQSGEGHRANEEHFWDMRPQRRLTTGGIRLTDYNFKHPTAAMETERMGDATYEQGTIESYDYPGDYLKQGPGQDVARLRTEQERGQDHRHRAVGDVTSLRPGLTIKVAGDKIKGVKDPCLCLSAKHRFESNDFATGDTSGEPVYEGSYVLLPSSAPMVPERKTEIPVIHGPQTAVVVGEGEIDCDEYGRILVHFHWDLDKRYSMRCRVSQNWASKGWGGMVIPRIGMEVVVEFLEGDPDKPLVTGCVYNGKNDVPYELPKHKTRSTFKTDTHQGTGFNELRFEDENGREEIYVHAEKDRNEKIKNNHTERIDNNWLQSIGHDKSIVVEDDHDEIIGGNMTIFVGSKAAAATLQKKLSRFTQGIGGLAKIIKAGKRGGLGRGNLVINTERNRVDATGMTHTEAVGVSKSIMSGGRIYLEAGSQIDLHSNHVTEIDSDGTSSLSAGEKVTINCGMSRITMEPDGTIHVHGSNVNFTAKENIHMEAGKGMILKSGETMVVKSGRVDIN